MKPIYLSSVAAVLALLAVTACATPEQEASRAAFLQKASDIRLLSPSDTEDCQLLKQGSVTEDQHFLGQAHTENAANAKLRQRAVAAGADAMRITDRQLDKGRGGYDKTRLTVYGDFYLCAKEDPS